MSLKAIIKPRNAIKNTWMSLISNWTQAKALMG